MPLRPVGPRPRERGFTLVELLVVIAILVVLLGALFPAFNAIRRSQRIKRTEATRDAIVHAIEEYQNDYGVYPPAEFIAGPNRGNRSLVVLLNAKGGARAPYLPAAFYQRGEIAAWLLLDEWDRPFIYFDTSAMKDATFHEYNVLGDVLGDRSARPAKGEDYYNLGRFQLWSCGPNERNDGGKGRSEGADDIANFLVN
jgi:prepilin-type N-terminal cleavage/methylation domain-containing protein